MPKLPDKIDDWTPPWERDGKEFDAELAKNLVFSLEKKAEKAQGEKAAVVAEKRTVDAELAAAQAQLKAKPGEESAKDATITKLSTELDTLKANGRPEDQKLIQQYGVALDVGGLPRRDAHRLVGDDEDSLLEDATEFAGRLAPVGENDGGNGQNGQQPPAGPPSRGVTPREQLGNGRRRQGETPAVVSVEEMMKDSTSGPGLALAPLSR